ncbi:MAG: hypothetical protein KJ060_08450, partial [Candidatus Hydrogenedentes bacterium]|nr:hypothetical protein [Candidatus Hydrogenedentota bacterium]
APPIAAVFLFGIFFKRVNGAGAMAAMVSGFVLGMGRLVLELNKGSLGDGLLFYIATINFLHFALLLFAVCTGILVVVSLLTRPVPNEQLRGLTFQTVEKEAAIEGIELETKGKRLNLGLTVVLLIVVTGVLIYFRG